MHNKDENLQKPSFMRVFLDELLERFWDTFGIKNEIADLDKFAKTQKKKARILVAMLVIVIVFCSLTVTGTTLVVKFLHSRQVERLEDKIDETEKLLKNAQGHIDNLKAQLDNIQAAHEVSGSAVKKRAVILANQMNGFLKKTARERPPFNLSKSTNEAERKAHREEQAKLSYDYSDKKAIEFFSIFGSRLYTIRDQLADLGITSENLNGRLGAMDMSNAGLHSMIVEELLSMISKIPD